MLTSYEYINLAKPFCISFGIIFVLKDILELIMRITDIVNGITHTNRTDDLSNRTMLKILSFLAHFYLFINITKSITQTNYYTR
jgi:hypothetical protein